MDFAIEQIMNKSLKSTEGLTHGRGLTDSVRVMWVSTMHYMATVHAGVTSLLNLDHSTNDLHHKESSKAHTKCKNIGNAKSLTGKNPVICLISPTMDYKACGQVLLQVMKATLTENRPWKWELIFLTNLTVVERT